MSAFVVFTIEEMIDPVALQEYASAIDPIVKSFDGKYLVTRGATTTIEGSWDPGVMALIEFPSQERMLEFYESDVYRPWRDLRHRSAKTSIVMAEG